MNTVVIKVGGAILDDTELVSALFTVIKEMQIHQHVVLVHGGGKGVENLLGQLGLKSEKLDGLRITPEDHIDYVVGALAGSANKKLCALAKKAELTPVGLSLFDGNSLECEQISQQLGQVGKAKPKDPSLLSTLLANGMFVVVSSIGADQQGLLLNVNADDAATAIANLLDAQLILLSDVAGVLDASKSLLPSLSAQQAEDMINENIITDGMVVKVKAAQQAATQLGKAVTIASWQSPQQLLNYQHGKVGTKILPLPTQEQ